MPIKDNREYLVISNDKNEPEIYIPLFPPLVNPKGKSKEILNEITSKQAMRKATEILEDNNKLLGL